MAATYTWDVFMTLDGDGSYDEPADWGGYWGRHGPELLEHRLRLYARECRMVFGATTMRVNIGMLGPHTDGAVVPDPWVERMQHMQTTVMSTSLVGPLDWPDATIEHGDAVTVVERMKSESDIPIRSHGSLTLNRALLAAGLVDRLQVTIFPVISGRTGADPLFAGAEDFDLALIDTHTFDGHITELSFRPTLRTW